MYTDCAFYELINCFCGMVDRRKAFNLISSRDHCQRSSPSRISDTPRTGFKPAQNLSSGLVGWSCAVVIPTTPRRFMLGRFIFLNLCPPRLKYSHTKIHLGTSVMKELKIQMVLKWNLLSDFHCIRRPPLPHKVTPLYNILKVNPLFVFQD